MYWPGSIAFPSESGRCNLHEQVQDLECPNSGLLHLQRQVSGYVAGQPANYGKVIQEQHTNASDQEGVFQGAGERSDNRVYTSNQCSSTIQLKVALSRK